MAQQDIVDALGEALLKHLRIVQSACLSAAKIRPAGCLISYGELINQAELPITPLSAGGYLWHVADRCNVEGWPPLHALVVNKGTGIPGDKFEGAPGSSFETWLRHVARCFAWNEVPAHW